MSDMYVDEVAREFAGLFLEKKKELGTPRTQEAAEIFMERVLLASKFWKLYCKERDWDTTAQGRLYEIKELVDSWEQENDV